MTAWKVERCGITRLEEVLNNLETGNYFVESIHSPTKDGEVWTIVAYKNKEPRRLDEAFLGSVLEETIVDDDFMGGNA